MGGAAVRRTRRRATEHQLLDTAAQGLGQMYFRDNDRRAHDLLVEFTDVEEIEVEL